jgi:hypothetical protein
MTTISLVLRHRRGDIKHAAFSLHWYMRCQSYQTDSLAILSALWDIKESRYDESLSSSSEERWGPKCPR